MGSLTASHWAGLLTVVVPAATQRERLVSFPGRCVLPYIMIVLPVALHNITTIPLTYSVPTTLRTRLQIESATALALPPT